MTAHHVLRHCQCYHGTFLKQISFLLCFETFPSLSTPTGKTEDKIHVIPSFKRELKMFCVSTVESFLCTWKGMQNKISEGKH